MKKYNEMMEHIHPTEIQKNNMLNKALNGEPKKQKFKLRYCTGVIAVGMMFSMTVFADEIKDTVYNLLGREEIVSENVLNEVYSDTDGHVKMTIKELLSDNINSRAIIEYTALDDTGKDWLKRIENVMQDYNHSIYDMRLSPHFKDNNTALYGVNSGFSCYELEEYTTETTRVFEVSCETSGESYSEYMVLSYPLMNTVSNETMINISESVKLKDVRIDGVKEPEKHYRLTGVKYSPLSIMLYGENHGLYEAGVNEFGGYYQKSLSNEQIDSLYIIMKDGSKINLEEPNDYGYGGWMLNAVTNPEVDYDVSIYCCSFTKAMNVENIAGIEFDSIYYALN